MFDCIAEKNSRDKWIFSFIVNFLLAVLGGMILGFLPEVALRKLLCNSRLEPFSPAAAVCALLLGFFVSPKIFNGRAASWIWVIGTFWLIYGIHETMSSWNADWATEKTAWGYANANLFGPTPNAVALNAWANCFIRGRLSAA